MSSIIKVNTVQDTDGNNIINENANTITIGASGDTITIPAGATLANNGTATGFASIAWQSSIVTAATLTAEAGKGYRIDTSSNACTITLPGSASVGDQIIFTDYARNWGTNAVTINQNSLNFQGNATPNPVYNTNGQSVDIVYSGATKGWIPNSDDDVTFETVQFTGTADFLVIAGGGSGGWDGASGGGAGGYRASYNSEASGGGGSSESSLTLTQGTTYTITVGAGGAAPTGQPGNDGVDSSISGSDITDITSVGGGGGVAGSLTGRTGGSGAGGGGSGGGNAGGAGTANQGFAGGPSVDDGSPGEDAGGGGGAGEAGNTDGGVSGGDGVASTITGSSVTRGGGGGGNDYSNDGTNPGGDGGGGSGGTTAPAGQPVAGTDNTGGGGGGGSGNPGYQAGGAGGSGVVILRVPTAEYSGTTSGSPTVTTDGTDTILTFTGSGSYTP